MDLPIKWSGSKRLLANEIISYFPLNKYQHGTFYELFCGGCSVTLELLRKHPDSFRSYVCIDNNVDLINLWQHIKTQPDLLADGYEKLWKEFNHRKDDTIAEQKRLYFNRKLYFNCIRDDFNSKIYIDSYCATLFLFLLRCAFSGLVRYNSSGVYNSSCHFTRPGIHPDKLRKIIIETSNLLQKYDVNFICENYKNIIPNENDFVFMDPPYSSVGSGSGKKSMYHGGINIDELIEYCNNLQCGYALTFDGDRGENKANKICLNNIKTVNLEKKNSSYSRLNGKQVDVEEIMYIKNK